MNERIKELWEQSTGAAVPAEGFYSSASKYNIEKFAELIVRECAKIANEPGARIPGYYIKKHFGVEE